MPSSKDPTAPRVNEGEKESASALEQARKYIESFLAWCEVYAADEFAKVGPVVAEAKDKLEMRINKFPNLHPTEEYFFELIKRDHNDFQFELFDRWKEECKGESATSFESVLPGTESSGQQLETERLEIEQSDNIAPAALPESVIVSGAPVQEETIAVPTSDGPHNVNEEVPLGFDPSKWSGTGVSPEEAYNKYHRKVDEYADEQVKLLSNGATDEEYKKGEAIINGLRDRILEAAKSDGSIPYEKRFRLDPGFSRLNLAAQAPETTKVGVTSQADGGKEGKKLTDFSQLGALREALATPPAVDATLGGEGGEAHKPATREPAELPPGGVPSDDSRAEGPNAQKEKEIVEKMNEIKKEIEVERATIEANKKKGGDKKAKEAAEEKLDDLHHELKDLAFDIVGGDALQKLVKPADAEAAKKYRSKFSPKLSQEERKKMEIESGPLKDAADANFEGVRRKKAFIKLLTEKGVGGDAAGELYQEWLDRAGYAVWLRGELEDPTKTAKEKTDILDNDYAIQALDWERIEAEEPKAVLVELTPTVERYMAVPSKVERPKKATSVKEGRVAPLPERVLSGEVDVTGIPKENLDKLALNKNEKVQEIAKAERARRDAEKSQKEGDDNDSGDKEKNSRKISRRLANVLDGIDAVTRGVDRANPPPEEELMEFAGEPEVAAFLAAHPEFAPKERKRKETIKGITDEAKKLIEEADAGEPSLFTDEDKKRIFAENDIPYDETAAGGDAFELLRERIKREMALTPFPVSIAPGDRGVLMFHTWRNKIPEGIQVLHEIGGGTRAKKGTPGAEEDASSVGETLKNVLIEPSSFLKRCSVDGVNISEASDGHCKVYVEFDTNPKHLGWNYWGSKGNPYAPFIRSLFKEPYRSVKTSRDGQKVTLRFSDRRVDEPATKIVFVAAESDTQSSTPTSPADTAPASTTPVLESRIDPNAIEVQGYRKNQAVRFKKKDGVDVPDTVFHIGSFDPDGIGLIIRETGSGALIEDIEDASSVGVAGGEHSAVVEKPTKVTDEARGFVAKVDADGNALLYVTESLKRILAENDIPYDKNMTPNDCVERIREKIKAEQEAAVPATPAIEAQTIYPHSVAGFAVLSQEIAELNTKLGYAAGDGRFKAYGELDARIKTLERLREAFFSEVPLDRTAARPLLGRRAEIIQRLSSTKLSDDVELTTALSYDEFKTLFNEKKELEEEIIQLAYGTDVAPSVAGTQQEDTSLPNVFRTRRDISTLTDVVKEGAPSGGAGKSAVETTPLNHGVVKQFEEKFGVTEDLLQDIEAFKGLSPGQQMLVLKNLEQITLGDIKKEAQVEQKKEFKEKAWWKKLLLGVATLGSYGHARTKGIEKELLAKARGGEGADPKRAEVLAEQLANIEALAKVAAEGPDVEVKSGGELEIKYLSPRDIFGSLEDKHLTPENLETMKSFNSAATAFAKLPREWGYEPKDEKTRKENAEYLKMKAVYNRAREEMLVEFVRRNEKDPERAAMLDMNTLDERVQLNQLFSAHPDAERALAEIEDQSVIREGLKDFWRDKGKYLALGAGIRIGAVVATGGVMAPLLAVGLGGIVGVGTGGLQGRNEATKLIRERRIDRRMSEEDERETIAATDKGGNVIKNKNGKPLLRKIKEYTDAVFFAERIERLSVKLEQVTDLKERKLLEGKIAKTTALMEEKYKKGLINFGGSSIEEKEAITDQLAQLLEDLKSEKDPVQLWSIQQKVAQLQESLKDNRKGNTIANRLSFMQALGQGHTIEVVDQEKLETEMARITGIHQAKITDLEQKEISRSVALVGLKRMGFALAGGYLGGKAIGWLQESGIFAGFGSGGGSTAEQVVSRGVPNSPTRPPWLAPNEEIVPENVPQTPSAGTSLNDWMEPGPVAPHPGTPLADWMEPGPTGTPSYIVASGDNFTKILKANIPELKDLSPQGQENAIQNLLKSLSPEELKAIGLGDDPNQLAVGQTLDLNKVTQLLHEKKIGDEDLLERASHLGELVQPVAPEADAPDVGSTEYEAVNMGTPREIPRPADLPLSMEETQKVWSELSDEIKYPQSEIEAMRYLTADIEQLFPKPLFAPVSHEWLSLSGRNALALIDQVGVNEPITRLGGSSELSEELEWPAITKIQQYIEEQGLTREQGYIPEEKETLEDFLKRALAEKVLKEGPSRPFAQGRILR